MSFPFSGAEGSDEPGGHDMGAMGGGHDMGPMDGGHNSSGFVEVDRLELWETVIRSSTANEEETTVVDWRPTTPAALIAR